MTSSNADSGIISGMTFNVSNSYLYTKPKVNASGGKSIGIINNNMTIDFNMAYNPPCVFSTFTTCPLPPKENILPVAITAGELDYNGVLFSSVYE